MKCCEWPRDALTYACQGEISFCHFILTSTAPVILWFKINCRASKSLNDGVPSSVHEQLLTTVWCNQASERVQRNLRSMTASDDLKMDDTMATVAKEVIANEGAVPTHPLRI